MTPSAPADTYAALLLARAPGVLGLVDREPLSPTAGCCDRTWWAWKFTDFPAPRFQEAVCFLAYLWATPLPGGRYRGNARLLDWIGLALDWWVGRQHADGSFDEAYPFERSLAATAFTSFYVAEALALLGEQVPVGPRERARAAVARAGAWLCRNDETHGLLSNHLAAAAAACQHAFRVGGDAACEMRSRHFVERILAHQSEEGWYREYEGADPGYQTHGSFYLARLLELGGDPRLSGSLARATRFLAHFVHPDGSLGGEYASRNTQTCYPAAFEMLAPHSAEAAWIAESQRPRLAASAAAGIGAVDAWNLFPMLNNLVFAHRAVAAPGWKPAAPREPAPEPGELHFPEAGLLRIRRPAYDAVVSLHKGGVVKAWDRRAGRLVLSDCGFVARSASGGLLTTAYYDGERESRLGAEGADVSGGAVRISRPTFDPLRFGAFRAFSISLGRFPWVARWLKQLLVHVLVYRRGRIDLSHARSIAWDERSLRIVDRVRSSALLTRLVRADRFAAVHMGSSRYFVDGDLEPPDTPDAETIDTSRLGQGVELRREVAFPELPTS